MICSNCQTPNPDGAKFCMNCGNAMALLCPHCGEQSPPKAKFCLNCGNSLIGETSQAEAESMQETLQKLMPRDMAAKLESIRASGGIEGERRILTILFCDVVGSTAAAENLDPEDWTEIMNGAFKYLINPIYKYEGTVGRLMGDAVLAFFGAPIAHEDDPQRAVLAGLEITSGIRPYCEKVLDKYGLDIDIRVGINTGLAVIGEVGSDLAVEYTAMGDAVNMAARMEQTAQPGTVQISANTHKLVAPLFDLKDLGKIETKGKKEPVQIYQVLHPKAEPGRVRGIEGLNAPLIGRDEEMHSLREVINELQQGRGQIVSVMGEAGLGKSRLVTEVRKALENDGMLSSENRKHTEGLLWLEGRSLSYETTTPYAPFTAMFNKHFQLRDDESDAEKYAQIEGKLSEFPDPTSITPFVATMLGIELPPEESELIRYLQPPELRAKMFRAIHALVLQLAASNPIALVFDDVHWIDPTSLDLLEQLLPATDLVGLLIIAIFRPRRDEPSWGFHEKAARDFAHRYQEILLKPLDEEGSRELVANLLYVEGLPETVRLLILKKAEGNPFFVEEVIRSLLDAKLVVRENSHWRATQEIEDISVPDTLAGVITSRLDRLEEGAKQVVQAAAVIGRQFEFDTLTAVHGSPHEVEAALRTLQRRELIREKSRTPKRVYLFKHALTQETAQGSLLKRKGQELHRQVAEYLEQVQPVHAGEIARHFLEAEESQLAMPYLVDAGEQANRSSSTAEAIQFFEKALELIEPKDDLVSTRRAYEGLASARMFAREIEGAINAYQSMLTLAQEHQDEAMQVSALNKMGFVTGMMMGQFPVANSLLDQAEKLARKNQDYAGLAELHMVKCNICTSTGDLDGAISHLGESTQLGRDLNAEEPLLFGLTHSANTLTFMGRFDEAWEKAQEALQIAREVGNQRYVAELLAFPIPVHYQQEGDFQQAREALDECVSIAARISYGFGEWLGLYGLGQFARLTGEYEFALACFERSLEAGKAIGGGQMIMLPLCAMGTVHLNVSEKLLPKTMELHAETMKLLEMPTAKAWGSSAWVEMGFCLLETGDLDGAEEFLQKGLTVPTTTMHLLRAKLLVGSGLLAMKRMNLEQAGKFIRDARKTVDELGMAAELPLVMLAEAQLASEKGDHEQALEKFRMAEEKALTMGMRPRMIEARMGAAQAFMQTGQTDKAEKELAAAREIVKEMTELFEDEELRSTYEASALQSLDSVMQ